ncbi:MAG: DUF1566 domain-containing protein [Spirochaetales bacterium]|nr:DUF1566 domain-containing protein [Spirochaetales bacterium]
MRVMFFSGFILSFGLIVNCASKKEDNGLTAAVALAQAGAYTNAYNGTVTDVNGNTWMKCTVGQSYNSKQDDCTGTGTPTVYGARSVSYCTIANGCTDAALANSGPAYDECNNLSLAGISGWRLPAQAELVALIGGQTRSSFLYFFPQTPDDKPFWGRDENSAGSESAYTVSFAESTMSQVGTANKVTGKSYVRCIKPK